MPILYAYLWGTSYRRGFVGYQNIRRCVVFCFPTITFTGAISSMVPPKCTVPAFAHWDLPGIGSLAHSQLCKHLIHDDIKSFRKAAGNSFPAIWARFTGVVSKSNGPCTGIQYLDSNVYHFAWNEIFG